MALPRPENGLIQTVNVNGLEHHNYGHQHLQPGDEVILRPVDNPHDSNAVGVYVRGVRVGWVPMRCNTDISRRLRSGEALTAKVIDRGSHHLSIEVYAPRSERVITINKLYASQGNGMPAPPQPVGTRLYLQTNPDRSSVSLLGKDGVTRAWFRKSEAPELVLASSMLAIVTQSKPLAVAVGTPSALSGYPQDKEPTDPESTQTSTTTEKEITMTISSTITTTIEANKSAAAQAGYLEAGRIANKQLCKVAGKAAPLMVRGYLDTPIGRLLVANAAAVAAGQLRPADKTLAKLTNAMTVAAYQEMIQTVDIEGWLDHLMGSPEMQKAMSKMNAD